MLLHHNHQRLIFLGFIFFAAHESLRIEIVFSTPGAPQSIHTHLQEVAGPEARLEVCGRHGLLQVERGLPVGLLGLADGERRPGAPLHELPLRRRVDALAGRALDVVVALGALKRQISG